MGFTPTGSAAPNADGAGGRFVFLLQGGAGFTDSHRISVHCQTLAASPEVLGDAVDWAYAAGTAPTGVTWTGSEGSIVDTFDALAPLIMAGYSSAWSLSIAALYRKDPTTGRLVQLHPTPNPAAAPGTGTPPSPIPSSARVSATIYLADDNIGGRFRLVLPSFNYREPQARARKLTGNSNPPGDALDEAILGYLQGSATRLLSKLGGQPHAPWTRNVTAMANLRSVYSAA